MVIRNPLALRRLASHRDDLPGDVPPALCCEGITKRFGDVAVVREVDLVAEPGELVALLGPSGCGKTTTLRLIAGFERPDAGTVAVGGRIVASPERSEPPERRRVGMVFQDYALFPHLTVGRNVAYGLPRGSERRARVESALATVGLDGFGERMPHELSGGQQQRVALARALAPGPEIVLLDEPFSNLDTGLRAQVRAEVRDILRAAATTAILVTHDQEEALSLCDRVAVMWDGTVVQEASPEELYHRPVSPEVASFVGDAQFLPGEARGRRVATVLGEVPMTGTASGAVRVMLRPEQLRLVPDQEGMGTNGTVIDREFYGHDQLMRVALDGDVIVRVRLGPYGGIRPGDRVLVTVRGSVLTFAVASGGD